MENNIGNNSFKLAWILTCILSSASYLSFASDSRAKALEILDKYAETQDKLGSFIIKGETVEKRDMSFSGRDKYHPRIASGTKTKYHLEELRSDGHRCKYIREAWGDVNPGFWNVPKSKRGYNSELWDSVNTYQYGRSTKPNVVSHVFLTKNGIANGVEEEAVHRYNMSRGYQGGPALGYLVGDDHRIDKILRKADAIKVKSEMEPINGTQCYVIFANTERGKYRVWIDPQHGYNITQATVHRKEGNGWYEVKLLKNCKKRSSIKNVRFKEFDGVWVSVEADIEDYTDFSNGDYGRIDKHYKMTELKINPDHDALGSFLTDDIENGAEVWISGEDGIKYTWKDGKVIDDKNNIITQSGTKLKKN